MKRIELQGMKAGAMAMTLSCRDGCITRGAGDRAFVAQSPMPRVSENRSVIDRSGVC